MALATAPAGLETLLCDCLHIGQGHCVRDRGRSLSRHRGLRGCGPQVGLCTVLPHPLCLRGLGHHPRGKTSCAHRQLAKLHSDADFDMGPFRGSTGRSPGSCAHSGAGQHCHLPGAALSWRMTGKWTVQPPSKQTPLFQAAECCAGGLWEGPLHPAGANPTHREVPAGGLQACRLFRGGHELRPALMVLGRSYRMLAAASARAYYTGSTQLGPRAPALTAGPRTGHDD